MPVRIAPSILATDLGQLRAAVEQEFVDLGEHAQSARSAMAKVEAGLLRRFAGLQHD